MGLFGKDNKNDPREQVREWSSKLRKQSYQLDRQIRAIQREEAKVKASLKEAAKKGDKSSCLVLAKSMVQSKRAIERMNVSKAQIGSIMLNMNQQLSNMKVAGAIQKSSEVMKIMQNLVKVHEISAVMYELSKEMMKAGIIEEMIEETIDESTGIDEEDMDQEVQKEVDKIFSEITTGKLPTTKVSTKEPKEIVFEEEEEAKSEEEEISEMQKRLQSLRS